VKNRPLADALMMRAGYAVTRAAYRPQAWRERNRIEGSASLFAGRHASREVTVSTMNDNHRYARGGDTINQAISFLHPVAGPVASDVDMIVADLDDQVRYRRIEVEEPRDIGLSFGRDAMQAVAGHSELPGTSAVIALFDHARVGHGIGHPVMDLALALVAKQ